LGRRSADMEDIRKLHLVENLSEVLENIKTFNKELPNSQYLIKRLTNFKQWYYSTELGLFAPSKFIGYKKNTALEYERGTSFEEYMDGRETEPIIKQWSLEARGLDYEELEEKLSLMLSNYDKKLRDNAIINLLNR